jgi:CHASE3 domain sensor protein
MSDIEKSFAYLHDNIPPWLKSLSEIEDKIAIMQNEISKVPVSPMKRKTASVESIRDLDDILDASRSPAQALQSQRRNDFTSALPSIAARNRSRAMMIIVYYDGQIQKEFEQLVRNIGTGRNLLRKGRMAARAETLAELDSSESDVSDNEDMDDIRSKIQYRRRAGLSSMRARPSTRTQNNATSSTSTPESLFEAADKNLEEAQALCERAAHQSLREGDCRKELDGMRKHFQQVLDAATTEVAKHKARREQDATKRASTESKRQSTASIISPRSRSSQMDMDIKPVVSVKPSTPALQVTTQSVDIEIDDDDDEDLDFVMPPVRLTSRA